MIFIENNIESKIVERLAAGSVSSPELVEVISNEFKVTSQGVYKAIQHLINEDVLTKSRKTLSLNNIWIEKLKLFTEKTSKNYYSGDFDDYLLLEEKEKVSYVFKNAKKLDNQWLHFILIIAKRFSKEPIYIWNPHHWFLYARPETESVFFNWINENDRNAFLLIGGKAELDKIAKINISSKNISLNLDNKTSLPKDKYITVIGDYLIYTQYSKDFSKKLEYIFDKYPEANEELRGELNALINKSQNAKIVLEKNFKKASRIARVLRKDFYVPKNVRGILG